MNNLLDIEIIQLDENFNHLQTIKAKKSNIKNNIWEIDSATIYKDNNSVQENKNIKFNSHFNFEKINNLYSNLSSITMWGLFELKRDYDLVNYSTVEIEYHLQKIMSYPFYLTIMSILSMVLMMNIKYQRSKIIYVTLGILISVSIYYINYFLE